MTRIRKRSRNVINSDCNKQSFNNQKRPIIIFSSPLMRHASSLMESAVFLQEERVDTVLPTEDPCVNWVSIPGTLDCVIFIQNICHVGGK